MSAAGGIAGWSAAFAPMLPLWAIAGFAAAAVLLLALGAWRRAGGLWWRAGGLALLLAVLLDPSLVRLNTSNFKKAFSALFSTGALVQTGGRAPAEGPGRPGELYRFSGPLSGTWRRELRWQGGQSGSRTPRLVVDPGSSEVAS